MTIYSSPSTLPEGLTALVHHVELNRSGWWNKATQRLILASVWYADTPPSTEDIKSFLSNKFHVIFNHTKIDTAIIELLNENLLIKIEGEKYRIPDAKKKIFNQEIAEAEKVSADAYVLFSAIVNEKCKDLNPENVWCAFESEFLMPLIKDIGANAYHLIIGKRVNINKDLISIFLSKFDPQYHRFLKELVPTFLDPSKSEVTAYISRLLHARFCVEACGLPATLTNRLNEIFGKKVQFNMFVDTNFLFSILELHENPSNAAAKELKELLSKLKTNPKIKLFIIPNTIDEVKSSINSTMLQLSGIHPSNSFSKAALNNGMSGLVLKFFSERLRLGGNLTAEEWFEPYLKDFITIANSKGISIVNENMDRYSKRPDVINDISDIQSHEEKYRTKKKVKSYGAIAHDMVLWHFVNDKRPTYIESPIDAEDWILTVDFRLIGFDEHKKRHLYNKVPLCIHPTSLIQLLQFWVPRTKEFEEAMLGSMRLPFLFQEFDAEAERTSLRILKCLSRYNERDDIPEQTITNILLNEELRSRLQSDKNGIDSTEIALIRDALLEEANAKADFEAANARALLEKVISQDSVLNDLETQLRKKDEAVEELRTTFFTSEAQYKSNNDKLSNEVKKLNAIVTATEEEKKRRLVNVKYIICLVCLVISAALAAWLTDHLFSRHEIAKIFGIKFLDSVIAVLVLCFLHFVLEIVINKNKIIAQLWLHKQSKKLRKRLLYSVILVVFISVFCNLYSNMILENWESLKKGPQNSELNHNTSIR